MRNLVTIFALLASSALAIEYPLNHGKSEDVELDEMSCKVVGEDLGEIVCDIHCMGHEFAGGYCSRGVCYCHSNFQGIKTIDQLSCHVDCLYHARGGYIGPNHQCICYDHSSQSIVPPPFALITAITTTLLSKNLLYFLQ